MPITPTHPPTGEEVLSSHTEPQNGTVISAAAWTVNVTTIRCNIHVTTSGNTTRQVSTNWQLENYHGMVGLVPISTVILENMDAILIAGDNVTSDSHSLFPTYRNTLTILRFIPDFHGTVLSCGRGDTALNIGRFPLVIYSERISQ